MVEPAGSPENLALVTLGGELARVHDVDFLADALRVRLGLDRRGNLATFLLALRGDATTGPLGHAGLFAMAVLGRLRVERRDEQANALVALLGGGAVEVDPLLWLDGLQGLLARRSKGAAELREHGQPEIAQLVESTRSTDLESILVARLRADGHRTLADSLSAASYAFNMPERGEHSVPPPAARLPEPASEGPAALDLREELGRAHPTDVLAYALVARLRAEGRDLQAGSVMMLWARDVGPIIDPGPVAASLVAQLRIEGREALADQVSALLCGISIDRDPGEILALWLHGIAGPIVALGPLAAALVAALRKGHHHDLADAVAALLNVS